MGLRCGVSLPSCAVVEVSLVLEVVFLTELWQVVETPWCRKIDFWKQENIENEGYSADKLLMIQCILVIFTIKQFFF